MTNGGYCPRCKAATYGEHECPRPEGAQGDKLLGILPGDTSNKIKPEAVRDKEFFLEIIESWTHYWMNQTQNSEADRANYFRRAFGVDANMRHHLAMKMHVAFEQMRKMYDAADERTRWALKERDRWKDLEKIARFDVENRIAMLSCERDQLIIALVETKAECERMEVLIKIADELITNENAKEDWENAKRTRHQ